MTKLLVAIFTVACFLITGCCPKEVKETEKVSFTLKDFPRTDSLVSEEVSVPVHPGFLVYYSLVRDSLVLVSGAIDTTYYIHVYNRNTKKFLSRHAKRGNGESEFQSTVIVHPKGWQRSAEFCFCYAEDFSFFKLHIDSLSDPSFRIKGSDKIHFPTYSNPTSLVELENKEYIVSHIHYGEHSEYRNDAPPFIRFRKGDYSASREKAKIERYSVGGISQALQFYNPKTKQFWNLDITLDVIRIYDAQDTRLVKELCGPYHFSPQYITKERFDGLITVYYDGIFEGYSAYCLTDRYVYLLFSNECYPQTHYVSLPNKYTQTSEVYQLDWEGNLIHRYVLDRHAMSLDLDEKEEYFYCTVAENRRYPWNTKWMRYKIK